MTDGYVDPALMDWTAQQLTNAVLGELGEQETSESKELRDALTRNVHVFSGFKTYHTLRAATDELMDADGQFRSFPQFKQRILAIDAEYNVRYLRAEYEHAIASAQMAQQWQDIQAGKDDFPFLRYDTAGDDRVRVVHAAWDGIIRRVDDDFWKTHYPPNDWGCRCDVDQVASDEGGKDVDTTDIPPAVGMFANNVGIDGVVFPKSHPYYTAPKSVAKEVATIVEKTVPTPKKRAPRKPKAKPVAAPPQTGTAIGTPVSKSMKPQKPLVPVFTDVSKAIDGVHGDGVLPQIPVITRPGKDNLGVHKRTRDGTRTMHIGVRPDGDHARLTMVHEIGHFLDANGLGRPLLYGSRDMANKEMRAVMEALHASPQVTTIREARQSLRVKLPDGTEQPIVYQGELRYLDYLLRPAEQWARAYAQYIAVRSNDATLLAELAKETGLRDVAMYQSLHWSMEDFAPIGAAIDAMFRAKGWMR